MHNPLRFTCIALIAAIASACAGAGGPPPKTELLPADGGELGKAFADLQSALTAVDKVRVGKLLDPDAWHVDNKEPSWFTQLVDVVKDYKPTGGKRQGDRATLFVVHDNYYAMMNATHAANGWQFDSPLPTGSSTNEKRDCATAPQRFPCGATSAPDSQVSGTASEPKISLLSNEKKILQVSLIDGFAVRMLKHRTKVPVSTRLVLSGTGVNPQLLALSGDPGGVQMWLGAHVLTLDIATDGKSAHGKYDSGMGRREFDVKDSKDGGLSLDTSQPNRLRGHVTADVKDAGKLDVTFDVGTASECIDDYCYDAEQASEPDTSE